MSEVIQLSDSPMDMMRKMSQGNPGALSVVVQVFKGGGQVDPDDFLGGIGALLHWDSMAVRGSRIWMLYKDVSEQHLSTALGLTRAVQLGILGQDHFNWAIDHHGDNLDIPWLLKALRKELPNFRMDVEGVAPDGKIRLNDKWKFYVTDVADDVLPMEEI